MSLQGPEEDAGRSPPALRVDDFDFALPEERIALRPVTPRDAARLLVVRPGAAPEFEDRIVRDLPDLLAPGDVLVVNDTRVIPARLQGLRQREDGAAASVEVTLTERLGPDRWRALARPAKRLRPGDRIRFGHSGEACLLGALDAVVEQRGEGGEAVLAFDFTGPTLDEAIEATGVVPLPPYIASRRAADDRDRADYQTMFAAEAGAVAAPTAGLHFTPDLLERLTARGVTLERVTLHVGPGTFLPVKAERVADHRMHSEFGRLDAATAGRLRAARARGGRVVAVGTTALRVLETAAADGGLGAWEGETDIFITPGYRFRAIDALLTNFHLPRSTLLMLVAAFVGMDCQRRAYAHALARHYRFYSYGDACLLFPPGRDPGP